MKLIYFFIIIFYQIAFSQSYLFQKSIGEFKNASSFSIASSGFIYVTDLSSNEVYRLDTLGNISRYVGGFGWDVSNFDEPVHIYATPLNIYITDKNNHRIQRFDKDLNYIAQIKTKNDSRQSAEFGYPLSSVTSNQGDLFILDSENKRILKFDMFGNYIQQFGGFDAGRFSIDEPVSIAVTAGNNLFVLDRKVIVLFDQYGNGLAKINIENEFSAINILYHNLLLTGNEKILHADLRNSEIYFYQINFIEFDTDEMFRDAVIFNNALYVLTAKTIYIFYPETE